MLLHIKPALLSRVYLKMCICVSACSWRRTIKSRILSLRPLEVDFWMVLMKGTEDKGHAGEGEEQLDEMKEVRPEQKER